MSEYWCCQEVVFGLQLYNHHWSCSEFSYAPSIISLGPCLPSSLPRFHILALLLFLAKPNFLMFLKHAVLSLPLWPCTHASGLHSLVTQIPRLAHPPHCSDVTSSDEPPLSPCRHLYHQDQTSSHPSHRSHRHLPFILLEHHSGYTVISCLLSVNCKVHRIGIMPVLFNVPEQCLAHNWDSVKLCWINNYIPKNKAAVSKGMHFPRLMIYISKLSSSKTSQFTLTPIVYARVHRPHGLESLAKNSENNFPPRGFI